MTEPQRIADVLTEGTDLAAAAPLVALSEDAELRVHQENLYLVPCLEALACLRQGERTPLGCRVAMVLRADGCVSPYPAAAA